MKGEYTHNVPLSYTLSSSPAVLHHSSSAVSGDRKRSKPSSSAPARPLKANMYSNGNHGISATTKKGDNSKGGVGRTVRTTPSSASGLDADRRNSRTVAYEKNLQCIEDGFPATNQSERNSSNNYGKSEAVTSCESSKGTLVYNTKRNSSNYSASDGSGHGSGLGNIDSNRERVTDSRVQFGNSNTGDTSGMLISSGNCADYVATASKQGGSVVVWKMTSVLQVSVAVCFPMKRSSSKLVLPDHQYHVKLRETSCVLI